MKVRARLSLLGAVMVVFFALTLAAAWRLERQRAALLVQGLAGEEEAVFGRLLDLKAASLRAFASDYTFWDDMVHFVQSPSRRWAVENIDTALGTFGADAAWVYRTDASLVYAVNETKDPGLDVLPMAGKDLPQLFARGRFIHFFLESRRTPVEIVGATIHPTSDPKRTSAPRGYFFVARLWDEKFVEDLSTLVGGPVHLLRPGEKEGHERAESRPGVVMFTRDLEHWRGVPVWQVHVSKESPVIREVDRVSRFLFLLMLYFAFVAVVVPGILLIRWVNRPLQKITRSLEAADPAALERLPEERNEFGELAGVVRRFLGQEELLRQAKADAERANLAKSDFLSQMSHELRTPLNAILGFAQLLEMDNLGPDQRESVSYILNSGRHLLNLINEVLDIARIEAGRLKVTLEPVRIADVAEETFALMTPLAQKAGVRLENGDTGGAGPRILADRQRVAEVLLNLLANGIKYNRRGGRVRLSWTESSDGRVRVSVQDTGAGIAPEQMERLFTPFERLGAEHLKVEGSGLGLALSKRLVEAMGGTMGADSVPGEGSTFWLELATVASD